MNEVLLSNSRTKVEIMERLTDRKRLRRAVDMAVLFFAFGIAALILGYDIGPILVGVASGISAVLLLLNSSSVIELTFDGVDCTFHSQMLRRLQNTPSLIEVAPGEYSSRAHSLALPHWNYDNILVRKIGSEKICVSGPLMHLRILVRSLQKEGVNFSEDRNSSYRMI